MTEERPKPQDYIISAESLEKAIRLLKMRMSAEEYYGVLNALGSASLYTTTNEQEILDELRAIVVQLYDNGFKDPLATFDGARQILKKRRQHPGGPE